MDGGGGAVNRLDEGQGQAGLQVVSATSPLTTATPEAGHPAEEIAHVEAASASEAAAHSTRHGSHRPGLVVLGPTILVTEHVVGG